MLDVFSAASWTPAYPARFFANWTTAVNTRSLSYCLLSDTVLSSNSKLNLALLFYENPTGKISALLQRGNSLENGATEWTDITSQGSRSLPDAFRNGPGPDNNNSKTLYESDTSATFGTPFTCQSVGAGDENGVELLFYSSNATNPFRGVVYEYGFSQGMRCAYSYP